MAGYMNSNGEWVEIGNDFYDPTPPQQNVPAPPEIPQVNAREGNVSEAPGQDPSTDSLNYSVPEFAQFFGFPAYASAPEAMSGLLSAPVAEPGREAAPATTQEPAPSSWSIDGMLKSIKKLYGFDENPENKDPRKNDFSKAMLAATVPVAGSILAGAASGYFTGKDQEEKNRIAQQQVDVNAQLASSQNAINEQKLKNQGELSNLKFKPSKKGLINNAARWVPVQNRRIA